MRSNTESVLPDRVLNTNYLHLREQTERPHSRGTLWRHCWEPFKFNYVLKMCVRVCYFGVSGTIGMVREGTGYATTIEYSKHFPSVHHHHHHRIRYANKVLGRIPPPCLRVQNIVCHHHANKCPQCVGVTLVFGLLE